MPNTISPYKQKKRNFNQETEETIEKAISDFLNIKRHCNFEIITFTSDEYKYLTLNWVKNLQALNIKNFTIFCLDESSYNFLKKEHINIILSKIPQNLPKAFIWYFRVKIFKKLVDNNVNFIHSDSDIVFLKKFQDEYEKIDFDILITQGSFPKEIFDVWKFTLCCGFFFARATDKLKILFERLLDYMNDTTYNDQIALNKFLFEKYHITDWEIKNMETIQTGGVQLTISKELITTSNMNIDIKILPFKKFSRKHKISNNEVMVHLRGSLKKRIDTLKACNYWYLEK